MKICLLTPRFPFPENGGDVLRINSIARYLKSCGNELVLLSFCFGEIRLKKEFFDLYDTIYIVKKNKISSCIFAALFALFQKPAQCGYYFSSAFLRQFRRALKAEKPDEFVPHLLRMVPYLEKTHLQKKSVVEMTDALSKTYALSSASKQKSFKKLVYKFELALIKKYERRVIKTFPKVVLVSENDIDYLKAQTKLPCKNLFCHSNGVSVLDCLPEKYNPNKICFVGNMRTLQNQDAVLYFAEEIFPLVKKENPAAEFYIVGAEPSEKIKSLSDEKSIFVTGFVENLEEEIQDSCVAVAPLRIAAGIQNKVLVAMGCGVPVVMTELISKAIPELSDGENCFIKNSASDFSECILRVMKDSSLRKNISVRAYETAQNCYSWNKKLSGYEKIDGGGYISRVKFYKNRIYVVPSADFKMEAAA